MSYYNVFLNALYNTLSLAILSSSPLVRYISSQIETAILTLSSNDGEGDENASACSIKTWMSDNDRSEKDNVWFINERGDILASYILLLIIPSLLFYYLYY